jgi:hypothetical protein
MEMVALMDHVSIHLALGGGGTWPKRGHLWGVDPTERSIWGLKWGTSPLG